MESQVLSQCKPNLTIILIPISDDLSLSRCLSQLSELPVRVIVVCAREPDEKSKIQIIQNSMTLIVEASSVPCRRAIGIRETRTSWLALIEDTCHLTNRWLESACQLSDGNDCDAATGPVALSNALPAREMAVACTEYGRFTIAQMFPSPAADNSITSSTERTAGVNMMYRRRAIDGIIAPEGMVESRLNMKLVEHGRKIIAHRHLAVTLVTMPSKATRVTTRYAHGRIYGGLHIYPSSLAGRLFHAAKCTLLPAVLFLRAVRSIPSGYRERFRAAGFIAIFELAWTIGECAGAIAGPNEIDRGWD